MVGPIRVSPKPGKKLLVNYDAKKGLAKLVSAACELLLPARCSLNTVSGLAFLLGTFAFCAPLVGGGYDLDVIKRIHLRNPNLFETNQFKQRKKRHDNLNP